MESRNVARNWIIVLCSAVALVASAAAIADPPGRVARLAHISGTVSFSPAGEDEWVFAQANRPLVAGDRLWSDAASRAELQVGSLSARLGSNTSASVLNLDDRVAQIEVTQGTLNLRVRRVYSDQTVEIDTPNLAFSVRRAGDYRIDVDPNGNSTTVRVRSGEGEAWGEGAAYVIGAGQQYTFSGEGLRDYSFDRLAGPDEFDNWCFDRNRREDNAVAARYVAPEMVGYSDLDDYGTWRNVESYGNVWFPTSVGADWVPYRTGHWAWIDPWGWTWIDEAPWGFAPFHYGRWAFVSSRWGWVPGPIAVRPIYAPALVAFIGGGGFSLSVSTGPLQAVAWFPLGPGEVYRPAYTVSRNYFTNVNVTNTVVNTTIVNNVYNNNVTNIVYRNREAPGAVTAVSTTTFTSAQPVARHVVAVPRDVVTREPVSHVVAVAPTQASVLAVGAAAGGAAAAAAAKRPPRDVVERRVVAKTQPPPSTPSFSSRASALTAQPGRPLEQEKMRAMQPSRTAEQQKDKVRVVAPTVTPQPITKEAGKAGPGRAGPPPTAGAPQPPAQERAMREGKGGPPPTAGAPQPPGQERAMREGKGGPPPTAGAPQPPGQERAMREGRGGPPPTAGAPPQPSPQEQARERRGPPPGAGAPQPSPQEQARERRGPPPSAVAPERPAPPPQEQARERRGPPAGAGAPQPAPQEQARERRGPPPSAAAPQPPAPPPQEQARERRGPLPAAAAPPAPPQERRAPPTPPPQAAQPTPPQAAAPQPPQERGKGPPEGKGKEREREKDKDRKEKEGQ